MSDSVQPHRWQPTRLPHPWGSLGKNTGVGCHFLGKASAYNTGELGLIPGSVRSLGEVNGYPLQYSCLDKSYGQRSLAGCGPQGLKESDTTKATWHAHTCTQPPLGTPGPRGKLLPRVGLLAFSAWTPAQRGASFLLWGSFFFATEHTLPQPLHHKLPVTQKLGD